MEKILVVTFTGIGNMLMFLPALRRIREKREILEMNLLYMNKAVKNIFEHTNIFDNYIFLDKNPISFAKTFIKIRKEEYDIVINSLFSSKNILALIPLFSGATHKVGFTNSDGYNNPFRFIYNVPVKMKPNQHEINRRLELSYALSLRTQAEKIREPKIEPTEEERSFANNFYKKRKISKKDTVICVNVGCSEEQQWKQWNISKYAELCDKLIEEGAKIIINGSPEEKPMVDGVAWQMKHEPFISAGKTGTIGQVAAIIEKADLSITNDSGLMHVSVAVDTPVIAIYGPTDYTRTAPTNPNDVIVRKDLDCSPCYKFNKMEKCPYNYKCLEDITVDDVMNEVKKFLWKMSRNYE